MLAQYRAHRQAHLDALGSERAALSRAEQGLMRARRDEAKLRETLPIYEDQERAWNQLVDEGFAGRLQYEERKRQRIEAAQELKAQAHAIEAARASIQQSRERIAAARIYLSPGSVQRARGNHSRATRPTPRSGRSRPTAMSCWS